VTVATVDGMWRHPVKGFTPEPVVKAVLSEDGFFPFDRLFALEVGPSGFNAAAPKFISKMRFAVLARFPAIARIFIRYDDYDQRIDLYYGDDLQCFNIDGADGRDALCRHVETILARHDDYDPVAMPLKFLTAPDFGAAQTHFRFTDSSKGFVSLLNLNSLRDLGQRLNTDLDPIRLRANIWMEGLPPFEDHRWVGRRLRLGDAGPELEVLKPIERCVATHVNPEKAESDVDVCTGLWDNYGHRDCGIYARVLKGGTVYPGDEIRLA